jgi:hypothetical protein
MKKSSWVISTFCLASLLYVGCSKKQIIEVDNETQSVVDNAIADQEYMAIAPTVQQHALNSVSVSFKTFLVGCDTLHKVSGDTLFGKPNHVDPVYTMAVSGCAATLPDGKQRVGKLRIRFTGRLRTAGTKMIIKMEDYKADGVSFSCDSMIVTTVSLNTSSAIYNVKLVNGICQNPGFTIKYNCDRTITNSFTGSSPFISVYGTASGINRTGRAFTVNIPKTSPITKHVSCQYIDKGVLELTPDGFKTRTVDFGDGACDDGATFSVNGNTLAFKLK